MDGRTEFINSESTLCRMRQVCLFPHWKFMSLKFHLQILDRQNEKIERCKQMLPHYVVVEPNCWGYYLPRTVKRLETAADVSWCLKMTNLYQPVYVGPDGEMCKDRKKRE